MEYQIFSTPQALAQQFAGIFAGWTAQQLQTKPALYIALSGGSTPQLWFTELVKNFAGKIDWPRLHFFWVDERYVPHQHPESNYGVACRLLFSQIDIPQNNLHPVPFTGNINDDVMSYTAEIRKHIPTRNGWPVFDLVTLGMGTDGHTASIFPGQLALFSSGSTVCISKNPHNTQQRVTLTGQVINRAQSIYFMVTGKDKAPQVHGIFNGLASAEAYPAAHIRKENTVWLVDTQALELQSN